MKRVSKLFGVIFVLAFLVSCIPVQVDAASKPKLSKTKVSITVGSTIKLRVKGTSAKVKWSSNKKSVATVSKKGLVKAKTAGKAIIKAKIGKKTFKCTVTVKQKSTKTSEKQNSNETSEKQKSIEASEKQNSSETSEKQKSTEASEKQNSSETSEKQNGNENSSSPNEDISYNDKITVVKEYTLPDGIGWYTRHYMVIRNDSNVTLNVNTSSLAYDSTGAIISAADSEFDALGAGCTSVVCEAFETDETIAKYNTTIKASQSKNYESVIDDISYITNIIKNGAVMQVTNNGSKAAMFLKGKVLFFKDGELVYFEQNYYDDDDYELKPGDTITKQVTCYKDFDSIEFYVDGRRENSTESNENNPSQSEIVSYNDKITVVKEYTLPDDIGWYTRHYMVIRNDSNVTLNVNTSSLAYDSTGAIISAADSEFDALGAGCTSVVCEAFETDETIAKYNTTIKASQSKNYESVIDDISYVTNKIKDGAVMQVTNNGSKAAMFLKGKVLFFKDGELVYFEQNYYDDDDYELKPGDTITKQVTCYKDFDSIEFYVDGRRGKN